jgi:hypothetical protein
MCANLVRSLPRLAAALGIWVAIATFAHAHTPPEAMAEAAQRLLASLDEQQRSDIQFDFAHQERLNWQFVPMDRAGLPLKRMKPHQQHLAMGLLSSATSHRGLSKSLNIMALEQILHEMESNSPRRDPSLYHFFIFGTPSTSETWGWRVEGHHLSISVTLVDGQKITTTPAFFGANPAHVKQGPHQGLRVLHAEEDLARKLLSSLSPEQRSSAIIAAEAPDDIISGPGREAMPLQPMGLPASQMTREQRQMLMTLIREYVFNFRGELAREDMRKIREAGIRKVHFAWAGGDQPGQGHYYRVQGPTFIMEYDNTQNDANHIHVVWRDFNNDFGADLLKQHYETVPHAR